MKVRQLFFLVVLISPFSINYNLNNLILKLFTKNLWYKLLLITLTIDNC